MFSCDGICHVTNAFDMFPIPQERIEFLGRPKDTDEDGLAEISCSKSTPVGNPAPFGNPRLPEPTRFAIVDRDGQLSVIPDVSIQENTFPDLKELHVSAVLDRKVVRSGDALFVKGDCIHSPSAPEWARCRYCALKKNRTMR